eukprot:Tbor_TRINITY_DN1662_c0_g1::TRINITY_DN1662_c0_g1_i1::g.7624::m.7624/K09592/EGLN, HPH; hypoxia-inducible factor prolyl hydroxylase
MVAIYPLGTVSGFARHFDNPNNTGRILTFTFYLNDKWDGEGDGGQLAIYDAVYFEERTIVDPIMDRIVVFYSDERTPHAVLPTKPSEKGIFRHPFRRSITIWFSYMTPEQERAAYAGAFSNWIDKIKARESMNAGV